MITVAAITWGPIPLFKWPLPHRKCRRLHLLPVDKVLILIALHLILNGGLQVPNALECQLEVSLQALVSSFQTLQVHLLGGGCLVYRRATLSPSISAGACSKLLIARQELTWLPLEVSKGFSIQGLLGWLGGGLHLMETSEATLDSLAYPQD